ILVRRGAVPAISSSESSGAVSREAASDFRYTDVAFSVRWLAPNAAQPQPLEVPAGAVPFRGGSRQLALCWEKRSCTFGTNSTRSVTVPGTGPSRMELSLTDVAWERAPAGVDRAVAELLFDPQELVVLRHPVRPRGRAGLDLPDVRRDGEIRDRRVLGLAGTVRHH